MKCGGKEFCTVVQGCVEADEEYLCKNEPITFRQMVDRDLDNIFENKQQSAIKQGLKHLVNDNRFEQFRSSFKPSCCQGDLCNGNGSLKQNFLLIVFVWVLLMLIF